jgi:ABC-type Mn2+/Zn2+ transport system permease subunit
MITDDLMQNGFAASGIVAVLCGLVGLFLVLRAQTCAGHALSHVGFTGATGAVLIGISPLWGLIGLTLAAHIYARTTRARACAIQAIGRTLCRYCNSMASVRMEER